MRISKRNLHSKIIFCLIMCFLFVQGCKSPVSTRPVSLIGSHRKPTGLKFYNDISWVSLVAHTPLIDIENDGIPDGVRVKVYLYRKGDPKPVAGKGTIVFHLFQQVKSTSGQIENKELYQWIVTPDELARYVTRERFGLICHQLKLYWTNVKIEKPDVYLQAEFVRDDGTKVVSLPVYLAITITNTKP